MPLANRHSMVKQCSAFAWCGLFTSLLQVPISNTNLTRLSGNYKFLSRHLVLRFRSAKRVRPSRTRPCLSA